MKSAAWVPKATNATATSNTPVAMAAPSASSRRRAPRITKGIASPADAFTPTASAATAGPTRSRPATTR